MKLLRLLIAAIPVWPSIVGASDDVAHELGSMLASEKFCELTYNQEAIAAYIEQNVDEGDMGFASMLRLMTTGHSVGLKELDESGKSAHCTQIRRVAKKYNFTE